MAHHLTFGKIHVIEWLDRLSPMTGRPERRTGREMYQKIRDLIAEAPSPVVQVQSHKVGSVNAFVQRLKRIQQDFRSTKRLPLLHIETHGDEKGIGPDSGWLDWEDLKRELTPLNIATGCNLVVFLSACDGAEGIKMAQVMERAPFFALMGPKQDVKVSQLVDGLHAFYRKVIVERDGLQAMAALNEGVDVFRIYNCEQLFRNVWDWYLEGTSTEEHITPRVEAAVQKKRDEGPLSEAAEARFRGYIRQYILDYHTRFEESRRHFFMIDHCPSNHARFDLVLTPVEQRFEITNAQPARAGV